jgi:hypoxanthine phosphoribosyltransferase|nr:phosphoribosyltransferase [Butyrivibrio sp.]
MKISSKKLSMKELRKECRDWAREIKKEYAPDLIIFIAKSGFIIGDEFSKVMDAPLEEISAHREGGKIKKRIKPLFALLPLSIRNNILASNFIYSFNDKKSNRHIEINDRLIDMSHKDIKHVLLIDDSIDTGWTFASVFETVSEMFSNAEIRTLSFIKMKFSEKRFKVDYFLYEDTLILTPAQMDSEEHDLFMIQYNKWEKLKDDTFNNAEIGKKNIENSISYPEK